MVKHLCRKTAIFMAMLYSASAFSQLIGSEVQVWEKASGNARESNFSKEIALLNFNYGIKNKFLKKYIKYSRNKNHTLSLVHLSREDENIWKNDSNGISLSNNAYKSEKQGKSIKIRKRPSIFTFTGIAEKGTFKSDSIKLKFEDNNLYEIIFLPRKMKIMDINKIHSYLSIKYGISLEAGKYYRSDGQIIWDPEKHIEYRFRPTGLGRDDGNELYQKQSSNQEDQFLIIGKNDIKNTNNENSAVFDQNSFVIWSDDNQEMKMKTNGISDILSRNWEINFIGSNVPKENYKVRVNKNILNPESLPIIYWMILKDSQGETIKIQGVENNEFVDFDKVDFQKEKAGNIFSRFTFAVSPLKSTEKNQSIVSGSNINQELLSLDLDRIVLYPNPVGKGQTFTVRFPEIKDLTITIYDAGGRLITMEKIDSKAKSYTHTLSIQSSYLISLTQSGKVIKTFKLIVD
ncbi:MULTISPECIES: T9SS type A sorting domain-containing protein [unclassified Chryseobacterium]|uniref:T9SS type A sorting domain-containing protein n=1 Tax=unclassified Chryseobacterium TaxID=2593645 RepID=UPI002269A193|nr:MULTISPECIES: T9SS type A sorting domain-containing protein [unclassified Chryseobacterium]